jgi:hypothetical protein
MPVATFRARKVPLRVRALGEDVVFKGLSGRIGVLQMVAATQRVTGIGILDQRAFVAATWPTHHDIDGTM